mgnify:CR=1 FL=1
MSLFRYLFPKKIHIGSVWTHESDYGNPFSQIKYKVLDIQNGFVKYKAFSDRDNNITTNSTTVRSFYAFYREVKCNID